MNTFKSFLNESAGTKMFVIYVWQGDENDAGDVAENVSFHSTLDKVVEGLFGIQFVSHMLDNKEKDFKGCKTIAELHDRIERALDDSDVLDEFDLHVKIREEKID